MVLFSFRSATPMSDDELVLLKTNFQCRQSVGIVRAWNETRVPTACGLRRSAVISTRTVTAKNFEQLLALP